MRRLGHDAETESFKPQIYCCSRRNPATWGGVLKVAHMACALLPEPGEANGADDWN